LLSESVRLPLYQARKHVFATVRRSFVNITDPSVISMRARLGKLHGAYAGQRCFIMGNGPSLNQMDLNLFSNEYVWGANRCYLLFDRIQWRPKFYVSVDKRVVPDNASEINALSRRMPETQFFFPVSFRYKRILKSASNVYWYDEVPYSEENLPYSMFSTNAAEFIYVVRTVTVAMLQLAVYFGFSPIYLIGCDTSYKVPETVKYENEDPQLLTSTEDDPNHFSPAYFGKNKKWHAPHVESMIFHYAQAKKICDEENIKVINATVGGNMEIFPRFNYLDLFK